MTKLAFPTTLLLLPVALGFTPPAQTSFATFGNAQTKSLIRSWQPQALSVSSGAVMLPSSTENMKRFVKARIMLEQDPSLGCMAAMGDAMSVIICRFSKAEHQLVLPLWQPSVETQRVFEDLQGWHADSFGGAGTRLSGSMLDEDDREAWEHAKRRRE